jgi:hypothetical protein
MMTAAEMLLRDSLTPGEIAGCGAGGRIAIGRDREPQEVAASWWCPVADVC